MDHPFLASLRALHGHAGQLADLAGRGDWEALAAEAARNGPLFAELARHPTRGLTPAEQAEARQLGAAILAGYERVSVHLGPWLADVRILLRDLDRS